MTYRSDEHAVEARRIELERELDEVKARAADAEKFVARQRQIESELRNIEAHRGAKQPVRLPMLARAKIASPCSADWMQMVGDDRVRFCGACKKDVYNFSSMTAPEVEALMLAKGIDLCARLYRRKDGTIMTSDCSVGVYMKWMNRAAVAVIAFIGGAVAVAWVGRTFGMPVGEPHSAGGIGYTDPG
jgi:hypothetical protein